MLAMRAQPFPYVFFAVLMLAACSPNLRPSPGTAGIDLTGTWQLDRARSDRVDEELRLTLNAVRERQMKKFRSRPASPDFDGLLEGPAPDGQGGSPPEPWWAREQKRLEEDLISAIKPLELLRIVQAQSRVEMISTAGGARRVFEPARPSTLVTGYATLRLESGWERNIFVVTSTDAAAKLRIVERYEFDAAGDLHERLEIEMPGAKTQRYHVIYRRAP